MGLMTKMLIFGGAGSLGNELVKFYIDRYEIVVASRDEAKHWEISNRFKHNNLSTTICDVRDDKRVKEILLQEKPDIVIIAQALKQIDICEKFPEESVKTNILGILNIANAIQSLSLIKAWAPQITCFISTDKAAGPISIYGMCKSISEKIMFNLSNHFDGSTSKVIVVRYGNVLCSKGSIIPLLIKQSKDSKINCFTLTHPAMTRFMMTLSEAVNLINDTIKRGQNGEMWVPKLSSMKILDLIEYFSKKFNKPYKIIGLRGVEKLDEIMLTTEEALRTDVRDNYFVVVKNSLPKNNLSKEYSSADFLLTTDKLTTYMDEYLPTIDIN